jgi:hypothetical protein
VEGFDLEIWFPDQDRVSVFLESSFADEEDEEMHEVMLFALFAARQIANFGGDATAQSLSWALTALDEDAPLRSAMEKLDGVALVPPSSGGGRKGFKAEYRLSKRGFFKVKPKGFGMLGSGVGYYAPTSTIALLAYLLGRRESSQARRALALAANFVGMAGLSGEIGARSQAHVAMQAASAAWAAQMGDNHDADEPDSAEIEPGGKQALAPATVHALTYESAECEQQALLMLPFTEVGISEEATLPCDEALVTMRVMEFADPADPARADLPPERGNRFVAVRIEANNASDEEAALLPTVVLVDELGDAHPTALATYETEFEDFHVLAPGDRLSGWAVFELNRRAWPAQVLVALDEGDQALRWTVSSTSAVASSADATSVGQSPSRVRQPTSHGECWFVCDPCSKLEARLVDGKLVGGSGLAVFRLMAGTGVGDTDRALVCSKCGFSTPLPDEEWDAAIRFVRGLSQSPPQTADEIWASVAGFADAVFPAQSSEFREYVEAVFQTDIARREQIQPSMISARDGLKTCPDCAEEVKMAARICRFCGFRFESPT